MLGAIALSSSVLLGIKLANTTAFSDIQGDRTFYLYSDSSQALQTQTLRLDELDNVCGESVRFSVVEGERDMLAESIAKRYGARILFQEEACGVTSYYCYAPKLLGGVMLAGEKVNLHIAVGEEQAAVGSPIIFGGF